MEVGEGEGEGREDEGGYSQCEQVQSPTVLSLSLMTTGYWRLPGSSDHHEI